MYPFLHRTRARSVGPLLMLVAAPAASLAAAPQAGLYQVDRTFTMRGSAYGPTGVESTYQTDGQTGKVTVTRRALPAGNTITEQQPGRGPVHVCVRDAQPPTWLHAPDCGPANRVQAPGGRELRVECFGSRVSQESWQPLGDGVWEHRYRVPMGPTGAAAVPPAAMASLAPAIAAMEEAIRKGPPEHAEMARRQLALLRSPEAGGGLVTGSVVERWTRLSDSCPATP